MDKELVALVNNAIVGEVRQLANGKLSFSYNEEWRKTVDAFPLSLSMPLGQTEHGHATIHAYINGLLPDSEETRKAIARRYGIASPTAFKLIAAVGEDLAGAVQMVARSRLKELKGRQGTVQITEARLGEYLSSLRTNIGDIQITDDAGRFSLGGMQAKKAVYWVNGKWYEPRGRTPSTHIIKPPIPWLEGQVENEHFCLRLAAKLNLPACRSEVVEIAGKPNIVVWRYDRRRVKGASTLKLTEDGGTVVRLHQEDMCQALGVEPTREYQSEGGPGMKRIMGLLAGSGSPIVDRSRFMRACAFNFIILGTDAHAKNYSVLIEHGRFRFAPLYDINSILPYKQEMLNSRTLAMSLAGENKWRSMRLRDWQKAAEECGYPADEMTAHLRDLIRRAPEMAQSVRSEIRDAGLKSAVVTRLATGIATRCATLKKTYG